MRHADHGWLQANFLSFVVGTTLTEYNLAHCVLNMMDWRGMGLERTLTTIWKSTTL
jgi:hypothetical protein